jgi:hypothetical protein
MVLSVDIGAALLGTKCTFLSERCRCCWASNVDTPHRQSWQTPALRLASFNSKKLSNVAHEVWGTIVDKWDRLGFIIGHLCVLPVSASASSTAVYCIRRLYFAPVGGKFSVFAQVVERRRSSGKSKKNFYRTTGKVSSLVSLAGLGDEQPGWEHQGGGGQRYISHQAVGWR